MSNIQYAFISRALVPDRGTLQASIDGLGFDLTLHPEYTPFEDSGFLPFVLQGEDGPGFEITYQDARDLTGDDEAMRVIASDLDYCISMVWHGSMRDLACVMIVSYALAKDFGAVVSYEGNPSELPTALLLGVHEALREAKFEREQASSKQPAPSELARQKPWWKIW